DAGGHGGARVLQRQLVLHGGARSRGGDAFVEEAQALLQRQRRCRYHDHGGVVDGGGARVVGGDSGQVAGGREPLVCHRGAVGQVVAQGRSQQQRGAGAGGDAGDGPRGGAAGTAHHAAADRFDGRESVGERVGDD